MIWIYLFSGLLIGAAVVLLAWGARGWLRAKYLHDVEWLRKTTLRFNPNPINARLRVSIYYVVMGVLLVFLMWKTPNPLIGLGLWAVLQMLPPIIADFAWKQRRAKIDEQLPAAIAAMCNSIKAGLTLVQSIQRLGEAAPEPIRTEFRVMGAQYAYGSDLEATLREAKDRLKLANFNLFASAVLLNREMGGDVAETLDRISRSLDKLKEMRQTIRAHTSEGRTNIKVLLVAPVIMLLMMATVDYEGVKMLFTTPQGYGVLLVAALLTGTGVYFAAKITKSDV